MFYLFFLLYHGNCKNLTNPELNSGAVQTKIEKPVYLLTTALSICIFATSLKITSMPTHQNEIILYQPNESVNLNVRIEYETVWLTQAQIAKLFNVKQPAISKHLKNIFLSEMFCINFPLLVFI